MTGQMKNDGHVWDNKKTTAQMLGRWQPWHAGHQKLFEEILKKTGQVNITVSFTHLTLPTILRV